MQVESTDKNKVKLTFEVGSEKFEEGMQYAYNKNKTSFAIPGFRKGKVPRKMIEAQFGKETLYEDAINFVLGDAYEAAIKESALETVSKPEIDVVSVSAEEGVVFTAEVYIKPEVMVKDYKGLPYVKLDAAATDEEINKEIDAAREKNARILTVTDRAAKNGDIVTIDYEGFADGEAFAGGKGEDHELTLGSGSFIPGFEEQLVGRNTGDETDVVVTFPEDYHSKDLSGKAAVFKVKVKEIKEKELPELNDEFAQDVSEFDTLDAYKASIREGIEKRKEAEAKSKKESDVIEAAVANAEMDVPQVMIDNQVEQMVQDFSTRIRRQGLPLEAYLQYMGQTPDSLRAMYAEGAEKQVKGRLALEAIAKAEGFDADDDEINEEIEKMAKSYGMETDKLAEVMRPEDKSALKIDICVRKALDLIVGSAVGKDA